MNNGTDAFGTDPFARFTTIPNSLFRFVCDGAIGASEFLVAATLEKYAYGEKRACSPSVAAIAKLTNLSGRSVQTSLRNLEAAGVISRRMGTGRGHTTEYLLAGDKYGAQAKGEAGFTDSAIKGEEDCTHCDDKGCKTAQERVKNSAIKGEAGFTRIIQGIIQGNTHSEAARVDEKVTESKTIEMPFNQGFHPKEAAIAHRVVQVYVQEVKSAHRGTAPAREEVARILVEELAITEAVLVNAVRCYALETASSPADKRKSPMNFFREGIWRDYIGQRPPQTADELEAEAVAKTKRQTEMFAADAQNKASREKLGKLKNGTGH